MPNASSENNWLRSSAADDRLDLEVPGAWRLRGQSVPCYLGHPVADSDDRPAVAG